MDSALHDEDPPESVLSSRLLEPLRFEAACGVRTARENGRPDDTWQQALDALIAAMAESERVGAARYPGRFGRRDWTSRPIALPERES